MAGVWTRPGDDKRGSPMSGFRGGGSLRRGKVEYKLARARARRGHDDGAGQPGRRLGRGGAGGGARRLDRRGALALAAAGASTRSCADWVSRPAELDAFAVTTGPGSFTGLRIGLSSVQGLALASGRPCVGLSALDTLALAAVGLGREDRHADGRLSRARCTGRSTTGRRSARGAARSGRSSGARRGAGRGRLRRRRGRDGAPTDRGAVSPARSSRRSSFTWPRRSGARRSGRLAAGDTVAASALRPLYLRGADVRVSRP